MSSIFFFDSFPTPIGNVYIVKSTEGVCCISFPHSGDEEFLHAFSHKRFVFRKYADASAQIQRDKSALKNEINTLKAYFQGERVVFDFPLDLRTGTPFQKMVWEKLREIPYGECRSYKWVAEQIGNPLAIRAVGMANNKNPLPIVIPCHRVIGSNGGLVGYASGLHIKKWLLEMEKK